MSGIKFTIDLLDQATSKIDKTQSHLKSLEKQSEKTAKAIDGIASSLNKASVSQKILVEREAQAKRLAASQSKLVYTKENLSNIKEKGDLNDLSLLKYKADLKKYSADRARYNLETIKFKEKLNQEIVKDIKKQEKEFVQNIKKQGKEIDQRVTPISYIANPMGKAIGIVKTKGYSTMPTSIFEQTKIGGNYIPGYKDNYEQILKNNFTKELKTQQREAEKNTIRMAKEEIKATKERELAAKQEYKSQQERVKYNQKLTESYQKAKVTPINYVADSSGKIIGVASAGRATNANVFASMGMGGGRVPPTPPVEDRQLGFLGGRRTFAQIGAGYLGYRAAVGASNIVGGAFSTPVEMENLRASMGAMVFGSGTKNRELMKVKTEEHLDFLYKTGEKYGIDYTSIAPEYMRMMSNRVGGKSKFSEKNIQDITEAFTGLSRVSGLSTERTKLVFLAISQMMSRGKIQGQEMNQQLREQMALGPTVIEKAIEKTVNDPTLQKRNPGLYKLYSQYRNKKINIDDLMEKGVIGSGNLVHVLNVMQEMLGDMPTEKSHTFTGEVGRITSELKKFNDLMTNDAIPTVSKTLGTFASSLKYVNDSIKGSIQEGGMKGTVYDVVKSNKTIGQKATNLGIEGGIDIAKSLGLGWATKLAVQQAPRILSMGVLAPLSPLLASTIGLSVGTYMLGSYGYDAYKNYRKSKANREKDNSYANTMETIRSMPDAFQYKPNNMTLAPNVETQNMSYIPKETKNEMQFNAFMENLVKPQQVELVLRIEGNSDGVFPNIFTSAGKKLNPGSNMISGGQSRAN